MEYLMTYGWAILIISVVVGALFSLGVFAAGPKGGSGSCGSMVGFFCSGPQLASNGLLTATIGQIGKGSVTVTGLGCSNSSAMPSSFTPTSLPLQPSQTMSVSFTCNLPVKTMGSTFSGTLWMQYSQNGQSGLTSQIGTINAQVTQTAASGSLVVYTITVDYATNDNVWINGVAIVPSGTTELYQSGNVLTIDGADCSGPVGGWTVDNPANLILASNTANPTTLTVAGSGTLTLIPHSCFAWGTPVMTPAGDEQIQNITNGTIVDSFDPTLGTMVTSNVVRTFVEPTLYTYNITTAFGKVTTTADHPFYVGNNTFVDAGYLSVGNSIGVYQNGTITLTRILSVNVSYAPQLMYNLEVNNTHTYFADGFAVHNKVCP